MVYTESNSEFVPESYPPFPEHEFKTVPLETISLKKLLEKDAAEENRVFEACKTRGFFYLELSDCKEGSIIEDGAYQIASLGERIFYLPAEEKSKYLYTSKDGTLAGYKASNSSSGGKATAKSRDSAEFFNIAKNDLVVPESQMKHSYPSIVKDRLPMLSEWARTQHSTGTMIFEMLVEKLGIDKEEITSRHRIEDPAGDHVRMTRGPPRQTVDMPEMQTPSHTDFGTITMLKNWLGGLQVWSSSSHRPGVNEPDVSGEWLWVKPQKNCLIVNLGDAAVKFTNGVFCSGRHRVLPSPGLQGKCPRFSVVYFVRPTDDCKLKTLKGEGVPPADDMDEEGIPSRQWISQQYNSLTSTGSSE